MKINRLEIRNFRNHQQTILELDRLNFIHWGTCANRKEFRQ